MHKLLTLVYIKIACLLFIWHSALESRYIIILRLQKYFIKFIYY